MTSTFSQLTTLPNLLTSLRFIAAPALLWTAWAGESEFFLWILALTFLTDILDGLAARLLNQQSELGAKLDSIGDITIYSVLSISVWLLWPDIAQRERLYILITMGSFLIPVLIGILKFHALTAYHTILVKIAVAAIGLSFFLLFLYDIALPFRISALLCLLAGMEETLITLLSPRLRSNVPSLWSIIQKS